MDMEPSKNIELEIIPNHESEIIAQLYNNREDFLSGEITKKLYNSCVKIKCGKAVFTGFLMQLKILEKNYYFLITCEHCISEEDIILQKEIIIYYEDINDKKIEKNIKLDTNRRFIKTIKNLNNNEENLNIIIHRNYRKYYVTVIQIFNSDKVLNPKNYLEPDLNYKEGKDKYINKTGYMGGFPQIEEIKYKDITFTYGKICGLKGKRLYYKISSSYGSSGSPILNGDKKIIGIHQGGFKKKDFNTGTFIGPIIDDLNNESGAIIKMDRRNESNERKKKLIKLILILSFINILFFLVYFIYDKRRMKTLILEDGTKYYGYLKNDLPNGFGTQSYKNGTKLYEGNWKDGKYYGNGTSYHINGEIQYKGEWINNKKSGYGVLNYKNGNMKYKGHWKADKEDGEGIRYFLFDDSFVENYDRCEDFFPYDEDFINSYNKNYNIYDKEHICYEGQWTNGTKNGRGIYYYYNGVDKYNGEWISDQKSGKGELRDRNGRLIYYGNFLKNKKDGLGSLYDKNGLKYIGNFENDKYNGYGIYYNKIENYVIRGYFVNGELNGPANMYLIYDYSFKKKLFEGAFLNGKLDGDSKFYSDSEIISALYVNGRQLTDYFVIKNNTKELKKENSFMDELFKNFSIFTNGINENSM